MKTILLWWLSRVVVLSWFLGETLWGDISNLKVSDRARNYIDYGSSQTWMHAQLVWSRQRRWAGRGLRLRQDQQPQRTNQLQNSEGKDSKKTLEGDRKPARLSSQSISNQGGVWTRANSCDYGWLRQRKDVTYEQHLRHEVQHWRVTSQQDSQYHRGNGAVSPSRTTLDLRYSRHHFRPRSVVARDAPTLNSYLQAS